MELYEREVDLQLNDNNENWNNPSMFRSVTQFIKYIKAKLSKN